MAKGVPAIKLGWEKVINQVNFGHYYAQVANMGIEFVISKVHINNARAKYLYKLLYRVRGGIWQEHVFYNVFTASGGTLTQAKQAAVAVYSNLLSG